MDKLKLQKFAINARFNLDKNSINFNKDKKINETFSYIWFMRINALWFMNINKIDKLDYLFNLKKENNCIIKDILDKIYEYEKLLPEIFGNEVFNIQNTEVIKKRESKKLNEKFLHINILQIKEIITYLSEDIDNNDFYNNFEVLGWLHQYYNIENKEKVFNELKNNVKIEKDFIAIATQFFTPNWVVKYLVENSLGKIIIEKDLGLTKEQISSISKKWGFYIPSNDFTYSQHKKEKKKITEISIIDPCIGCGHILLYVFDMLIDIYLTLGYSKKKAIISIINNNIYGLDIDFKVTNISKFIIKLKALIYDENFYIYSNNIKFNIYAPTIENNNINEFGSLVKYEKINDLKGDDFKFIDLLNNKYDVVVTNPPYMGKKNLSTNMKDYLKRNYSISKSELYGAFIIRAIELTKDNGFTSMITIHSWLFISSFYDLREYVLKNTIISSVVHSGASTFEELRSFNALAVAVCLRKNNNSSKSKDYNLSTFIRLTDFLNTKNKIENFNNPKCIFYKNQKEFELVPNKPFIYWISNKAIDNFLLLNPLKQYFQPRQGLATANNKEFTKYWYEVNINEISFNCNSIENSIESNCRWFPYNKGGNFRKWFGANLTVVDWEQNGYKIRNIKDDKGKIRSRVQNTDFYFKSGITWSLFGFENFSVRYKENGFIFDVSGSSIFPSEDLVLYTLAFLSSKVAFFYLSVLAPTVNFQVGNIGELPFLIDYEIKSEIDSLSKKAIEISKGDWNDLEISWDFKGLPLIKLRENTKSRKNFKLENIYKIWQNKTLERFNELKVIEERINYLFIDKYNLLEEVTANVNNRDIAVYKSDIIEDIRKLISYSVGCMFGRYSVDDMTGIKFAGGEFKIENYKGFLPVADNLLIVRNKYNDTISKNENNMTKIFLEFILYIYGDKYFNENIKFIANALCGKDSYNSNFNGGNKYIDIINNYLYKDFYNSHYKEYNKSPIYKLISNSSKEYIGFSYIHRNEIDFNDFTKYYNRYVTNK